MSGNCESGLSYEKGYEMYKLWTVSECSTGEESRGPSDTSYIDFHVLRVVSESSKHESMM